MAATQQTKQLAKPRLCVRVDNGIDPDGTETVFATPNPRLALGALVEFLRSDVGDLMRGTHPAGDSVGFVLSVKWLTDEEMEGMPEGGE